MPAALPVLLCLDTATDRLHLALAVGADTRVRDLPGGAASSATLLPALAALLEEAGRTWADVDAIGFGSGPGAFTGLRTACSVAQGLALGLGRPVLELDTLMAVAEDARQAHPAAWAPGDVLWVLQDARMDELYVGAFEWTGQRWTPRQPPQLWPRDEPLRRWGPDAAALATPPRWAGNAGRAHPEALAALLPAEQPGANAGTEPVEAVPAAPRGAALAALARQAWAHGETADAALALPRYVRDKVAQTTAERAAGRAAEGRAQPIATPPAHRA
jgi:tRNA threonylcarbamoyladenosine biosynthesis protein TsaB